MVGYNNTERGAIPDPVFSNYLALVEESIYVNVDSLKDGTCHPNIVACNYCRQVIAKDQQ